MFSRRLLFMMSKIQKLSAIHNCVAINIPNSCVVYDVKDTKIVSNSQPLIVSCLILLSCLWCQRYKNCQQFTTVERSTGETLRLFMMSKIQKLSAIHNHLWQFQPDIYVVYDVKDTKIVSNSQRGFTKISSTQGCLWCQRYKIVSNSQPVSGGTYEDWRCLWCQRYKNCQQFTTQAIYVGL